MLAQAPHQALLLVERTAAVDLDVADLDPAAGGFFKEVQAAQEGGLARPAGADDGDDFAFLDLRSIPLSTTWPLNCLVSFSTTIMRQDSRSCRLTRSSRRF